MDPKILKYFDIDLFCMVLLALSGFSQFGTCLEKVNEKTCTFGGPQLVVAERAREIGLSSDTNEIYAYCKRKNRTRCADKYLDN